VSAKALSDAFYTQPAPSAAQQRPYYQLKHDVRLIRNDARELSGSLAKGAGRDETLPSYEGLMQNVRRAQDRAGQVFATQELKDKATAVRTVLNQITPYYDASAKPLEPATR